MKPQQVFDAALFGIRAQQYRQSISEGRCQYRGPDGLKCAIGHAIPEDLAGEIVEGTSVSTLMNWRPSLCSVFHGCPSTLLHALQGAHDSALKHGPTAFERRMINIAWSHNLTYTRPQHDTTTNLR